MNKSAKIILGIVAVAFGGLLVWAISQKLSPADFSAYEERTIYVADTGGASTTGANDDIKIATADAGMGGIPDHVKGGDIDKAKVVMYEYADYQCPGCATINPWVNELLEGYDGQVALVYRSYLLSYHQNARSSAAAANAAGLQGYWKPMADLLFANQSEWEYANPSNRTSLFVNYFEEVSEGQGDVEQFRKDISSTAVSNKIDFDIAMATKDRTLTSTPSFFVNGDFIDWYEEANTKEKFLEYFRNLLDPLVAGEQKSETPAPTE